MQIPTPEILRKLREDHELRQESLAQLLGVVQQTYSNYENGHSAIPLDYLTKLAKYYNVSTDYLLGLTSLQKQLFDLEEIYAQNKSIGDVLNDLLCLSPDRRRQLLDYLAYQVVREQEDNQKQKIKY